MILARGLAGLSLGAVESLTFTYYAVSFEKYTENLKTIGKCAHNIYVHIDHATSSNYACVCYICIRAIPK